MTWLYVLLGILLLFLWLFTRKIRIGAGFCEKPSVFIKILFLKLAVPSEKPKQAKEEPKEEQVGKPEKEKPQKEKAPLPKKTVPEYIEIFTDALKEIVGKLKKYLYLEKYILKVDIGTEDAAQTALIYGATCTAASSLWSLVCSLKRRTKKPSLIQTEIKPDFISEKTDFYADIVISIRIWQVLSLGMTALGVYNKLKKNTVR